MLKIGNNVYRNLQEQVEKNKDDITDIKNHGGAGYTASNGIKIIEGDIQADTSVLATLAYANTAAGQAASAVAKYTHKLKLQITGDNYDRYIIFMHHSNEPLTKAEFIEYITEIGVLPFSNFVIDEGLLALYIEWPNESVDTLEMKSLYIDSNQTLDIDTEEINIEDFDIVDTIIN